MCATLIHQFNSTCAGLGQHLLIISFSSKCHVNYMRVGGSLSLFITSRCTTKNNKQIEMILILISLFNDPGNKYFVPGHTKYVIVEHHLDCTGEEIALRPRRIKRCIQLDTRS